MVEQDAGVVGAEQRRHLQGVLLDMDGTLVDTEPYWFEAEKEAMRRLDGPWTHADQHACVGGPLSKVADYMNQRAARPQPEETVIGWVMVSMVRQVRAGLDPLPGVLPLLANLSSAGVPTALVSSSYRPLVDACVEVLGRRWFSATVAGDELDSTKPHPEPYLRAAGLLGVDPRYCVAIEDSPPGVASAEAAGCVVLVVPSVREIPEGPLRTVRSSLAGVNVGQLEDLVTLHRP